ncbi:MAG: hydroxyacid dehydrogenase [Rhodospirillaceae bacterium]|nr:hydroxyacid dehydrogenase [Rhodospirillaceae bacterium]|tara:strand:- start:1121 stop:2125 length:1005 start_codon:yes stop_codon:yes gene_type:complete
MRILITDKHTSGDEHIEKEAVGPDIELEFFDHHDEVTDEAWARADGIVTYRGTAAVMAALPKLQKARIVVRGGVGFDGLDLKRLGERGIAVCTVPDYGTTEVADHAIALMLALRRGLDQYDKLMRQDPNGLWRYIESPCIDRLRGKTFGVFGLGRIGLAAARRAQGFDMNIIFFDPHLPDGAELSTGYARAKTAQELFKEADTISIHCPNTDETRGVIDKNLLSCMKEKAIIINTARGPIVNLDALFDSLKSGVTAGAALDVLPDEPADTSHPLIKAYMKHEDWLRGRLMITPHAAFYSPPGLHDLRSKAVATVAQRLRDGSTRNCQNLEFLTS